MATGGEANCSSPPLAAGGPTALEQDAARGQSQQRLDRAQIKAIVETTLHTTPPDATHWSARTLARACGVRHMTVARIWDAHDLQPHRVRTFKLSRDPALVEKLTDVVGLCLNLVERWFAEITRKRIQRGSFHSVAELVAAIEDYLRCNNENPRPLVWTKRGEEILEKVRHCKAASVTQH